MIALQHGLQMTRATSDGALAPARDHLQLDIHLRVIDLQSLMSRVTSQMDPCLPLETTYNLASTSVSPTYKL